MSGNISGGVRAAKTNKKKYGRDFYQRIGALGGTKSRNCGFASDVVGEDGLTGFERARTAGSLGGRKSKRGKA